MSYRQETNGLDTQPQEQEQQGAVGDGGQPEHLGSKHCQ